MYILEQTYNVYPYTILWIGDLNEEDSNYLEYKAFVEAYSAVNRYKFYSSSFGDSLDLSKFPDYKANSKFSMYIIKQGGYMFKYPHSEFLSKQAISFCDEVTNQDSPSRPAKKAEN